MIHFVVRHDLLTPLGRNGLSHQVYIFIDDVMFLKPNVGDVTVCAAILQDFGEASGLRINSALHITCSIEQEDLIRTGIGCPIGGFPCRYLGLPLSIRKPSTTQFQEIKIMDRIAKKLPPWQAANMDKSAPLILVHSILCHANSYYDGAQRPHGTFGKHYQHLSGFLWVARAEAHGMPC